MPKQYLHILFDLDHTLWDFEKNSHETLIELFNNYQLKKTLNCSFEKFYKQYKKVNASIWISYNQKLINKETLRKERFNQILLHFRLNDPTLAIKLENDYINTCPKKTHLIPETIETLQYLCSKYTIHILTNGFKETQETKIKYSGIQKHINSMTTSECCGITKPSPSFFKYHLKKINAFPIQCIMIGDNPNTDIRGARASNIDSILFDPLQQPKSLKIKCTHLITHLSQLKKIL